MEKMLGYCGLDCAKCDAYLATVNDDQNLREKTAELWSRLNGQTILPEDICCDGCKNEGRKTVFCENLCAIRKCAVNKKVADCGKCAEFEGCAIRLPLHQNNPEALENLKGEQR